MAIGTEWTPSDIYRELESLFGSEGIPTLRSIERIVKANRPAYEESKPWSLDDFDDEDVTRILVARQQLIISRMAKVRRFTVADAKGLIRILKIAGDLPPEIAWFVSQLYRIHNQNKTSTDALDDYLVFAPWRTEQTHKIYTSTVKEGWIEPAPLWRVLVASQNPSLKLEDRKRLLRRESRLLEHQIEQAKKGSKDERTDKTQVKE